MPACLCDGEQYIIKKENISERSQILAFFLDGHREAVLALYDEKGEYCGCITYWSILKSTDTLDAIIHDKLIIGDDLWDKVQEFFKDDFDGVIPVFNHDMEMAYFAKYERRLFYAWKKLLILKRNVDKEIWGGFSNYKKNIHIKGMNDVLYELRKWLISLGTEVSVEGSEWNLFGIEETEGFQGAYMIEDESDYLDSLYMEYLNYMEDDLRELRQLLQKPGFHTGENKEKIMFYLPVLSYFVDCISPLIFRYLQSDKEVVIALPDLQDIADWGSKNIRQITEIIEKIKAAGGMCCSILDTEMYDNKYTVCYLCGEYSGKLPAELRNNVKFVAAVQMTAIYTHVYSGREKFEQLFSEMERQRFDYLITTEYIAGWICKRNAKWDEKILRLGCPKLDILYQALKENYNVPTEWKKKIAGKKVLLFIGHIKSSWLDFLSAADDIVAILRPHPLAIADVGLREMYEEIGEKYDIIIDDMPSYYAAFNLSDALITHPRSSVLVNYLYTEKPVCIYDFGPEQETKGEDYKIEPWYKSAYTALDEQSVLEFIKMIKRGEDLRKEELEAYRRCIVDQFDGEVCNRIYDYFEKSKTY